MSPAFPSIRVGVAALFLSVQMTASAVAQMIHHYGHLDASGNYYGTSTYQRPIEPLHDRLRNLGSVGARESQRDRQAWADHQQYEEMLYARERAEGERLRRLGQQEAEAALLRQRMRMQQEEHEVRMQILRQQLQGQDSSVGVSGEARAVEGGGSGELTDEAIDAALQRVEEAVSQPSVSQFETPLDPVSVERARLDIRTLIEERQSLHAQRLRRQRFLSSGSEGSASDSRNDVTTSLPRNFRFLPPAQQRRLLRSQEVK